MGRERRKESKQERSDGVEKSEWGGEGYRGQVR